jgi:glycosyltransferase involved in cell wall biosynthesis
VHTLTHGSPAGAIRALNLLQIMASTYPKISVITPSYNQAQFIEQTIRSVLDQNYPNLEYIIQDGGSTDGSVEIIKRYADRIDFWESGPDGGQSAAINKGFKRATGDFIMWINSDDMLAPGCLNALAESGELKPNRLIAGRCAFIDEAGTQTGTHQTRITCLAELFRLRDIWSKQGQIVQPETVFCRDLYWKAEGLDENNHYCMDYDLWIRMLKAGGELHTVPIDVGVFRRYEGQKVSERQKVLHGLCGVARKHLESDRILRSWQRKRLLAGINHFEENWEARSDRATWPMPFRKVQSAYIRFRKWYRGY